MNVETHRHTFEDLCSWLSPLKAVSNETLERLQIEDERLSLIALSNHYWLTGQLTHSIRAKGGWKCLDVQTSDYLVELANHYQTYVSRVKQEAETVTVYFPDNQLDCILLKGVVSLLDNTGQQMGTRFMSDIDLLVDETEWQTAISLLKQKGYQESLGKDDVVAVGLHQSPPLRHPGSPCCIEIHRWPLKRSVLPLLPVERCWSEKIEVSPRVYRLSANDEVILCISHSEIVDRSYEDRLIDLKQLNNLAFLILHHGDRLDWSIISGRFEQCGYAQILNATLFNLYQLFGVSTPITRPQDPVLKEHYLECISRYCSGKYNSKLDKLRDVLKGYSKTNILDLYGAERSFPVTKGRLEHLKRHVRLLFPKR
ncbi:nucleotidyltransferase family protein [Aestuariibacter salexigens]|uniref:nucleotidyltransferase family protein n=1 Tax=Aestuariibacter salexigens TaxID=226010 RepID=UPI0004270AF4|nr:nucleotidyltransferase family protein [Aestuariibacter salexigens]